MENLEAYLSRVFEAPVKLIKAERLGGEVGDVKEFGYGAPRLLTFEVKGEVKRAVLQTMKPDHFGHEHVADRAHSLIWAYFAYPKLPRHVKALDVGAFTPRGIVSLKGCEEFFLLVEAAEGREYWRDLEEIATRGELTQLDRERCRALSSYLAEIHSVRRNEPELYIRRIRELVGHGECIMGIIDNYPPSTDFVSREELMELEKLCVEWRWKLKDKAYRLCQVHGDFHPWNVLFREGVDFTVLDRSRGEWGEAADDVAAMTINYVFYSLRRYGRLEGAFEELYKTFLSNYLDLTGDEELLKVIQPFYAWRALVIASPIWYPTLHVEVRRKLLNLALNSLRTEVFEPSHINGYMGA
ncbi:MAG: aminoglycoside phosphotransferase family protein [Thermoprotei archaeon]|mgnify:CR=1 FL=1|nr:MAG: aminoglycoside phosphotransferase family protein [Thermoprotei archaeon]